MAKVLLLNPSKWGRGITPIWITSHSAVLKSKQHEVSLFDSTFYRDWSVDEVKYNTANKQYQQSSYSQHITFNEDKIIDDLCRCISSFEPDVIFWSAISSHIHGEGEYVNIQYGYQLLRNIATHAIKIAGGLQPTAQPKSMFNKFPKVNYFICGESEFVLSEIANKIDKKESFCEIDGVVYKKGEQIKVNSPQKIINDLDEIPPYDYSLFDDQVYYRPYNGNVVRAVDYELSRGCPYTCSYCVETVIQKYYGFSEIIGNGIVKNAKNYLRNKSAKRIFEEIKLIHEQFGVVFFRCQDTNFLTIDRTVLKELADFFCESELPIFLYIETRPETIKKSTIELLKALKVDGVGMGIELASEEFRKSSLNRYPSQEKITEAFFLLKEAGIKRTSYNIIGLPNETEKMIWDTIRLNQTLDPDNITVAFYSPYLGTPEQIKSKDINYFDEYEYHVDGQLRTVTKSTMIEKKQLNFYKTYFVRLVREGLDKVNSFKEIEGVDF